jgi:hypothetical protein
MQASIEPVDDFSPTLLIMVILGMLVVIGICLGELAAKFNIVMASRPATCDRMKPFPGRGSMLHCPIQR